MIRVTAADHMVQRTSRVITRYDNDSKYVNYNGAMLRTVGPDAWLRRRFVDSFNYRV